MKYKREIKVGILAIVCGFLLYFGMYYLKGVNIFSATNQYVGKYNHLDGLTEQAPVMIKGYKVGQVDAISYDFTQNECFTIFCSVDKHIALPHGTKMILVDDGLLGGKAIELRLPEVDSIGENVYAHGDIIPSETELGLIDNLEEGILSKVDSLINEVNTMVAHVNGQLAGDHLNKTLANVEQITSDLKVSAQDVRSITQNRLPDMLQNADTTIAGLKLLAQNAKGIDLQATVNRVDTAVDNLNSLLTTKDGTLGLLLNDKKLYNHVDSAVVSVDSLVSDLKANPKRYLHLSLFEKKEKKK